MRPIRHTVVLLATWAALAPALAQPRDCTDDRGQDRCAGAEQQRQRERYGVPAIETIAQAGGQMIRVFFVDGYGRDAGLVIFTRPRASEPMVEWRGADGKTSRVALAGIVPLAAWDALRADAATFDRALVPRNDAAGPSLCLHGWVVRVEAAEGAKPVRSATQAACGSEGLAMAYGFKVAKAAVSVLPACALLDPERARNDVTRLAKCTLLAGDRAAAAEAMNVFDTPWFANPRGPDFARSLQYLFYDRVEFGWPGREPVTGSAAAADVWTTKGERTHFVPTRLFGETPDRVRMEGVLYLAGPTPEAAPTPIPATMLWTRENGFGFRVRSFAPDSAAKPPKQ